MGVLVFIALLALALVATPYLFRQIGEPTSDRARLIVHGARTVIIGGLVVIALLTALLSSYTQIDNGNVGIVYQFGKIVGQIESGAHFLPPWQEVTQVNVQVQRARFHAIQLDRAGQPTEPDVYGRIDAASHETQDVFFDVTLNWQITSNVVQDLYRRVGPDFFTRLVPSRVNQYFKAETVKYEATEATQKREQIREDVTKALAADLAPYGITVLSLQIDNIDYNPDFKKAIEQKQIATQNAQAAQNQVAVSQANAAQLVAKAKGDADAAIESARGDAQSTLLKAQAQADANKQLSASLTPELIRSQAIAKWAGNMPAFLPQGGNVIVDPSSLFGNR